ncbi:hypothetical protein [Desulfovibrio fairfieldensis]|nr:hypothetical protein [Desulfovibrio fairfieldensis]
MKEVKMLQIDSLNHDSTCGFRVVFRFETYADVVALGHIIKGLVAAISFPHKNGLTPDNAFCETVSEMIPHESVKGITRLATYDAEESTPLLEFGALNPNDLEAINKVYDEAHGFRKDHGHRFPACFIDLDRLVP